jgi:hypothetical protein
MDGQVVVLLNLGVMMAITVSLLVVVVIIASSGHLIVMVSMAHSVIVNGG